MPPVTVDVSLPAAATVASHSAFSRLSKEPNGSGIVICAGGQRLPLTFANIAILRALGTTLPVEVWHLPGEMTPAAASLLRRVGAVPRRLRARRAQAHFAVPYAVAESGFEHMLVLDSDITPLSGFDGMLDLPFSGAALLASDYGDLRSRPWFPDAWLRLGLQPPSCPPGVNRCRDIWETESSIMVFHRNRCPGAFAALRALAADGQDTGRYGLAGDKELYRLALEAAGCTFSRLPYPGVLGEVTPSASDDGSRPSGAPAAVGAAMVHRIPSGELIAVHWAWGKDALDEYVPSLRYAFVAPLRGYAWAVADTHAEDYSIANSSRAKEFMDSFGYSIRLVRCFDSDDSEVPCQLFSTDIGGLPYGFGALYTFARNLLLSCSGRSCPLRRRPWRLSPQALQRLDVNLHLLDKYLKHNRQE